MSKVSRAMCYQIGALVLAIALAIALSRFVPVVNFIEALQQRVMSWGAWAAIGYPLLFALCNILLLPGGILAVAGGCSSENFPVTQPSAHWAPPWNARVGRSFS